MNVTIRKAREDELPTIQDLNYQLFLWDYERDPALNINWPHQTAGEDYFRKMISGDSRVCFVAEMDNEIVGYIAGSINKRIDATDTLLRSELKNIFVKSEARGMGIGTLLTQRFMDWCKQNGAQSILVKVYEQNKDATEFYKACGFESFVVTLEKPL